MEKAIKARMTTPPTDAPTMRKVLVLVLVLEAACWVLSAAVVEVAADVGVAMDAVGVASGNVVLTGALGVATSSGVEDDTVCTVEVTGAGVGSVGCCVMGFSAGVVCCALVVSTAGVGEMSVGVLVTTGVSCLGVAGVESATVLLALPPPLRTLGTTGKVSLAGCGAGNAVTPASTMAIERMHRRKSIVATKGRREPALLLNAENGKASVSRTNKSTEF